MSELRLESDDGDEDEEPYYPEFNRVSKDNYRFMWLPSPSTYERYNGNPFANEFEADLKTSNASTTSTQLSTQPGPSVLDEHPLVLGPDCQSKLVGLGISASVWIPEEAQSPSHSYQTNDTPISSQNRSSGSKNISSVRRKNVAQTKAIGLGISACASHHEEHPREINASLEQSHFISDNTSSIEEDVITQAKPIGLDISARASYSDEPPRNVTPTSDSTSSMSHSKIDSKGMSPSSNLPNIDIATSLQISMTSSLRSHDSTGSQRIAGTEYKSVPEVSPSMTIAGVEYKYAPEASSSIAVADVEGKMTHKRGLSGMVKTLRGRIVGKN